MSLLSPLSLATAAVLSLSAPAAPAPVTAESTAPYVVEIQSFSEISPEQPGQTLFLFDIDDTLFDSPYMLGSKAWREYIAKAVKEIDPNEKWQDIFSYTLGKDYPVVLVETMASPFIRDLQDRGYIVCGFTSREPHAWYGTPQKGIDAFTREQLRSVDIIFDNKSLEDAYPQLSKAPECFEGIFFAKPKDKYLFNLLENAPERPTKVVFVDDKASQVRAVAEALNALAIPYECYIYSATDKKAKAFNPLIANIQLYYFYESDGKNILSDEQALSIAEANPEKTAEDYLRAVLIAKKSK